jgi:hypothetical protein
MGILAQMSRDKEKERVKVGGKGKEAEVGLRGAYSRLAPIDGTVGGNAIRQ